MDPNSPKPNLNPTVAGQPGESNPTDSPSFPSVPRVDSFLSPPQQPDEIGRLGDYRILEELGRGGMGAVFRAEDTKLKRQIALKVMLPHVAIDDLGKARFRREAEAQARVDHEHVAVIHHICEANGVLFIAMPLLKGQTLSAAMKQNARLPITEVIRIGREMAEGLAAAHDVGLIHRDIKPSNIWLEGPKRRVRILDFGLARVESRGENESLTSTGEVIGTPAYMSPEQAHDYVIDHRADLFSLGIILYQMTTGVLPFTGRTSFAMLTAVTRHEPPAPVAVVPDIPVALSAFIQRLLAKDPNGRPQTGHIAAAELEAIQSALNSTPIPATPLSSVVRLDPDSGSDPWPESDSPGSVATASVKVQPTPPALPASPLSLASPTSEQPEQSKQPAPPKASKPRRALLWTALGVLALLGAGLLAVKLFKDDESKGAQNVEPQLPESKDPPTPAPTPPAPTPPTPTPTPGTSTLTAENRKALEAVLELGGKVAVRVGEKEFLIAPGEKFPSGEFAVQYVEILDAKGLDHSLERLRNLPYVARSLALTGPAVTNAEIAKLVTFPGLVDIFYLDINGSQIDDRGLADVKRFTKLTSLKLAQTSVTNAGLAHLRELKLTHLMLHMCKVDDDGMDHLADMTTLDDLWLKDTGVGDAGIKKLSRLRNLKFLHPGGKVTDGAVDTLLGFRELKWLHCGDTGISDTGLKKLSALPELTVLTLTGTKVTDDGLAALKNFPALETLNLSAQGDLITDMGLKHLEECAYLRLLSMRGTKVTEIGAKRLAEKLPLCRIELDNQIIQGKPVPVVLRASVAGLLKAGAKVTVEDHGMQRSLKTAEELTDLDRVWTITFGSAGGKEPFDFPAAIEAFKLFPFEGWQWTRVPTLIFAGPITEEQFHDVLRVGGKHCAHGVELHGTDLPESALAHLSELRRVRRFHFVRFPKLTEAGLKRLAVFRELEWLGIHEMDFPPMTLAGLRGFAGTSLDLKGLTCIDDTAVEHLAVLPALKELNLEGTKMTKAGVEKLAKALPQCRIAWNGFPIEPTKKP